MRTVEEIGAAAKRASYEISVLPSRSKNRILKAISEEIIRQTDYILSENQKDLALARQNGVRETMLDRLLLTEARIREIARAVETVIELDDPIGAVDAGVVRPNGLRILKTRVPLGVVGIIFESRPNVTVDAATLCLKAGNAVVLRGGKEAIHSNMALCAAMRTAIQACGSNPDMVNLLEDVSRESANRLMRMNEYLDVLIPRGGAGLIRAVVENATLPVIQTGVGNCHIYVDRAADLSMAVEIVDNAKTSRPSVCNAAESLLVHREIAETFLPIISARLAQKNTVLLGCPRTCEILDGVAPATEEDYATEFLDYKLSIKVVDDVQAAIEHINRYGTGHSEAIVTNDLAASERFTAEVDAAAVYVNASTRFTDGGEFGFGAEIGISTQKLHARGPMGLQALTSTKYVIHGNGQIR